MGSGTDTSPVRRSALPLLCFGFSLALDFNVSFSTKNVSPQKSPKWAKNRGLKGGKGFPSLKTLPVATQKIFQIRGPVSFRGFAYGGFAGFKASSWPGPGTWAGLHTQPFKSFPSHCGRTQKPLSDRAWCLFQIRSH